jgi:futalosine hydrolase
MLHLIHFRDTSRRQSSTAAANVSSFNYRIVGLMPDVLILVPTPTERQILVPLLHPQMRQFGGTLHLCGFGPVAAAARTSQLIAQHRPSRIMLAGIAGAIGDTLSVGSATEFDEVACSGVGVGTGADFQTASQLGWSQWDSGGGDRSNMRPEIGDVLPLTATANVDSVSERRKSRQLLTCCSGSANREDVELKSRFFPDAIAEDMEAFGVAMAAALASVPVQVVRGISNNAGDRRLSQWKINDALNSTAQLVLKLIADDGPAS